MVLKKAYHGRAEEAQAPAQPLGPHVAALGMRFWNGEPHPSAFHRWHKCYKLRMHRPSFQAHTLFCLFAECAHQVILL